MKKTKIVHILYSFGTGGMEKGIATVINHGSTDFEHIIVCMTTSGESKNLLTRPAKIIELNKPEGNSLKFIIRLMGVLKDLQPDVVHTRNWSGMDGIIAARLAGVSSVVHGEHGWGVEDISGLKLKRVLIRRILSLGVKEFTCVSRQMVEWLNNSIRVGSKRITQIYNGIDCDKFHPVTVDDKRKIRAELGLKPNQPVIGIIGRLDPVKDHLSLFDAFLKIRSDIPEAILLVVGDGPYRNTLEKKAAEGIIFLGNRPDVDNVLSALDVFVLTSLNEGISNTILEAMATALPVVATNVGGTPEILDDGKTGVLVEPKNISAMASAIKNYVDNPDIARQHGAAGREKVMGHYSVDKMVSEYEKVWMRVVGKG